MRKNISSGGPWEQKVGYSRAVQVDNRIFVSGTTAVDTDGKVVGEGDVYLQTKQCIQNIERALLQTETGLEDVVRTRTYITDISKWEAYAKAHAEFFEGIDPAATLVEVSALIRPDLMVEMEVDVVKS